MSGSEINTSPLSGQMGAVSFAKHRRLTSTTSPPSALDLLDDESETCKCPRSQSCTPPGTSPIIFNENGSPLALSDELLATQRDLGGPAADFRRSNRADGEERKDNQFSEPSPVGSDQFADDEDEASEIAPSPGDNSESPANLDGLSRLDLSASPASREPVGRSQEDGRPAQVRLDELLASASACHK